MLLSCSSPHALYPPACPSPLPLPLPLQLHIAAHRGQAAVISALLAGGASPRSVTTRSWTPLHFAALHGDPPAVQALLGAAAAPATDRGSGGTRKGPAFVNVRNEALESPLHLAVQVGSGVAGGVLKQPHFCSALPRSVTDCLEVQGAGLTATKPPRLRCRPRSSGQNRAAA